MVLNLYREALDRWIHRWTLGHRPGAHDAVDLEAHVEVVCGRLMLLHHKNARGHAANRELLVPFDLVGVVGDRLDRR
jgi:hypothetical protein